MFYEVLVARSGGSEGVFTYAGPENCADSLLPGQIVEVPLKREKSVGVVVKKVAQPEFKTKPIARVIYSTPLPRHLLKTVEFISEYYQTPAAGVLNMILPKGVEKQRRSRTRPNGTEQGGACPEWLSSGRSGALAQVLDPSESHFRPPAGSGSIQLNPSQKNALRGLQEAAGATKLLHGVTGSGKTNIYLEMAAKALKRQKSAVLLVPEIALTGQLVQVFSSVFGDKITLIHSGQTEVERHRIFEELLESTEARIVIGPRSALFAPLVNLGLIIIDEEHEATYSQENTPKYSAIRVASYMAGILQCDCILGSATPTVADYYLADQKKAVVTLTERAKLTARKADIEIIDFKNRDAFSKNRYFSNALLAAIRRNLEQGWQTLIFHNRRGSAPLTLCESCGEELVCPNCYLPLTLHADTYELVCHTCGHRERVPTVCPHCGSPEILHKGFGTKLLENELSRLFPKARVRRFDADNKKGEGLDATYTEVKEGEVDILVGTQTVAKGLDLPRLATVGVVQADAGLSLPDFAAEERTFQLLTQVIGRVGRGHLETAEVFIQTFQPEHPVILYAAGENYLGFYEYALGKRRKSMFPPFGFVAVATITMKTEATAVKKVRELARKLSLDARVVASPPMPAFHERTARGYTWQIVARAKSRKVLMEVLSGIDKNFKVTFDPPSLL